MLQTPFEGYDRGVHVFPFEVVILCNYASHLANDLGLAPSSISTYLQGIKHNLELLYLPVDSFDSDPLRKLKRGAVLGYRKTVTIADTAVLPFTIDMLVIAKTHSVGKKRVSKDPEFIRVCKVLACELALVGLFRASELVVTQTDHFLRRQDVEFVFRNIVGTSSDVYVCGYDANVFQCVNRR